MILRKIARYFAKSGRACYHTCVRGWVTGEWSHVNTHSGDGDIGSVGYHGVVRRQSHFQHLNTHTHTHTRARARISLSWPDFTILRVRSWFYDTVFMYFIMYFFVYFCIFSFFHIVILFVYLVVRISRRASVQIAAATLSGNSLGRTVHTHRASVH